MRKAIASIVAILLLVSCSGDDKGTDPTGNNAPVAPSNPQPASGASGVSTATQLAWQCSDPEGDSITYDVAFGISNPPPAVSNDQATSSYNPGQLATSTTYYWKVTATDAKGASTSGPVWSFSTVGNQAPEQPSSPSPYDGFSGQIVYGIGLAWECSDPDGDPLTYDLYVGTTSTPQLVQSNLTNKRYDATSFDWFYRLDYDTDYYWKIVAKDNHGHETPGPVWHLKSVREVQLVGRQSISGTATEVAVSGGWAYVVNFSSQLIVIDVSTPTQPQTVAIRSLPGIVDVDVVGTTLFALRDQVLQIFDVSVPSSPQQIGQVLTDGTTAWHMCRDGNLIFMSTSNSNGSAKYVEIADVSNPAAPVHRSTITRQDWPYLAASNGTLYIADAKSGAIYDVTSPQSPVMLSSGNFTSAGLISTVAADGNRAYVASSGLTVYDVSNPATPVVLGHYQKENPGSLTGRDLEVVGNTAYVASIHFFYKGLWILDVSDPTKPTPLGHYYANGLGADGVAVVGNYMYLAGRDEGLLIVQLL